MKNLVGCALLPHPPIMIPEIGKDELAKIRATVEAVTLVAQNFKQNNPDTVVIMTPHSVYFKDAVALSVHPRLRGNFAKFGAPEISLGFETDGQLIKHIIRNSSRLGIHLIEFTDLVAKSYRLTLDLDHGALVPLYYLHAAGFKGQIVHLAVGMLSYEEMYTFGKAVQVAIGTVDRKTVVIASGDLSHRLLEGSPNGYDPQGAVFDQALMEAMRNLDVKTLFNMDKGLIDCAGECGLRPACFLLGVMGGLEVSPAVVSYEGPFGVGYGVISYHIAGKKQCVKKAPPKEAVEEAVSDPVALAKKSLLYYLELGKMLPAPKEILPPLDGQAGVFVSLKKYGDLRGCIGTFLPTEETIAQEIIKNAVSAGVRDPRFQAVDINEFPQLEVSVDILSAPEQVSGLNALDPRKYGVIVRHGNKSGLLLPDLEGIDTPQDQIAIAMQKAGIPPQSRIDLFRFTVTRYK